MSELKKIFAVCSKGKEMEVECTTYEGALRELEAGDYYMPTIEVDFVDLDYYNQLLEWERESEKQQWDY